MDKLQKQLGRKKLPEKCCRGWTMTMKYGLIKHKQIHVRPRRWHFLFRACLVKTAFGKHAVSVCLCKALTFHGGWIAQISALKSSSSIFQRVWHRLLQLHRKIIPTWEPLPSASPSFSATATPPSKWSFWHQSAVHRVPELPEFAAELSCYSRGLPFLPSQLVDIGYMER